MVVFFWSVFITAFGPAMGRCAWYPVWQTATVAGLGHGRGRHWVAVLLPLVGRWFDQQRYT